MRSPAVRRWTILLIVLCSMGRGCSSLSNHATDQQASSRLCGAWRAKVQFRDGAYAAVKDLEFLYVFHADGTMTESSNYDGAPPVAPAYGMWQSRDERQFDARYIFFTTKPPADLKDITSGGGWTPAGYGVLTEHITLAPDGRSFTSRLRYEPFDTSNKSAEGGGTADVHAQRITLH